MNELLQPAWVGGTDRSKPTVPELNVSGMVGTRMDFFTRMRYGRSLVYQENPKRLEKSDKKELEFLVTAGPWNHGRPGKTDRPPNRWARISFSSAPRLVMRGRGGAEKREDRRKYGQCCYLA